MGVALAKACLAKKHDVVIVSGPVAVVYPKAAKVIHVVTTDEMLDVAVKVFADCDGAIGAAAPCDYQPLQVSMQKISKTGQPLVMNLIETPDIVATLGQLKRPGQWVVGFALESDDRRFRATVKLEKKHCDMIVSNGPEAIDSDFNQVELLAADGSVIATFEGTKQAVARSIVGEIDRRLIGVSTSLKDK